MTALLALLLGCWSTHTATMKSARSLEASGELDRAEATWARAMGEELTLSEWERAYANRCALLVQRMTPEVTALTPETITYERAAALHDELGLCPEAGLLDAEVWAAQELRAEAALAEADALLAEGRRFEALRAAAPHLAQLRARHPRWTWFAELQHDWRAELDGLSAALPAEAEVTRAALGELMRASGAGPDPGTPSPAERAEAAVTARFGGAQLSADETCAGLGLPPTLAGEPGGALITLHVSGCREGVSAGTETVRYTETRYRTEIQTVTHTSTTRVTTVTPTYNVNCYNSLKYGQEICTTVGYYTDYDTETTTSTWEEQVEVQVPYQVELTRQGVFATRTWSGAWRGEVSTADGLRAVGGSVSRSAKGPERTPQTPQAEVLASAPSTASVQALLREAVLEDARARALDGARALRLDTLAARGADRADAVAAREALLVRHALGAQVSAEDLAFVAEGLSLPEGVDPLSPPRFDALRPAQVEGRVPTWQIPEFSNTVSRGYPPFLGTLAFSRHEGAQLAGQPERLASGLAMSVTYGVGWVHKRSRGVGVHASPSVTLHSQKRRSEAYVFPPNAEGFPNEEELDRSAGYSLSAGLTAGARARHLGVFAGVTPRLDGHLIGFYNARSAMLLPTLRLELRPIERYPILAELWWGDVRWPGQAGVGARGGQLWFPLGLNSYLHVRVDEAMLRTQFKGLASYDDVDAGLQPMRSAALGLSFGF